MSSAILLLIIALQGGASASSSGALAGVIRDSQGVPVPNALIIVRSDVTGAQRTVTSDISGQYIVSDLQTQSYTVEAVSGDRRSAQKVFVQPATTLPLDLVIKEPTVWTLPPSGTVPSLVLVTLIALLVTETGRVLFRKLANPLVWFGDWWYGFLAPRFPEWIGLPGYRRRVLRSQLARIENPVGPQELEIPVHEAFVPIRLIGDDQSERVDVFPFVASHERIVVLGGAGTGKTTLMKSLIINILRRKCHGDLNDLIPVFVVLRDLAKSNHDVEDAIVHALGQFGFKSASKFVNAALESGRLLIILDGLDEVGVNRQNVAELIRKFCHRDEPRDRRNHLIVTCREASYTNRDLSDVLRSTVRVEPFAAQHIRQFLQNWPSYRDRAPLALYTQIQDDVQVSDTCRNPLMLTILTGLFLEQPRFDLPSSRERFYHDALQELIERRPERRSQQQLFPATDKWQILQTAALDRLETVDSQTDPEVLSRTRFSAIAKAVLGPETKDPDIKNLLNELVHVNEVLKAITQDEAFLFGHRTFQEYLAAREANKTRETEEIVELFSGRPELVEVLCFYVGLLHKVPEIRDVLERLVRKDDATICGRALVNVTEAPPREIVQKIVSMLPGPRENVVEYQRRLEILASLSRRRGDTWAPAQTRFTEVVEEITSATAATQDVAAMVSTLSGNPELAASLVPGLLSNNSALLRSVGVQLLADLDDDESLDQLVRLLQSQDADLRIQAAVCVAELMDSHSAAARKRAVLLPGRLDMRVWPFEEDMPGRLVLPVIETLATADAAVVKRVKNVAIVEAVAQTRGERSSGLMKSWRRAPRDRRMHRRIQSVLVPATFTATFVAALTLLAIPIGQAWCVYGDQMLLVQLHSPHIRMFDGRGRVEVRDRATEIKATIDAKFPTSAKGLRRVLPWNWASTVVPDGLKPRYDQIANLAAGNFAPPEVVDLAGDATLERQLNMLGASGERIAAFQRSVTRLATTLPRTPSIGRVWMYNSGWLFACGSLALVIVVLLFLPSVAESRPFVDVSEWFGQIAFIALQVLFNGVSVPGFLTLLNVALFVAPPIGLCFVLSLLKHSRFPANPYMLLTFDWTRDGTDAPSSTTSARRKSSSSATSRRGRRIVRPRSARVERTSRGV